MQNFYYSTKLLNIKKKYFIPFSIYEGQFELIKYKKTPYKINLKNIKYKSLLKDILINNIIFNYNNLYKFNIYSNIKKKKKIYINDIFFIKHLWFYKRFYFPNSEKKYKNILKLINNKRLYLDHFSFQLFKRNTIHYNYYFKFLALLRNNIYFFCMQKVLLLKTDKLDILLNKNIEKFLYIRNKNNYYLNNNYSSIKLNKKRLSEIQN